MNCHNCGKDIRPDFNLCPYCGESVSSDSEVTFPDPKLQAVLRFKLDIIMDRFSEVDIRLAEEVLGESTWDHIKTFSTGPDPRSISQEMGITLDIGAITEFMERKGPHKITLEEMKLFTVLDLSNRSDNASITDLSGIESAINLISLDLSRNLNEYPKDHWENPTEFSLEVYEARKERYPNTGPKEWYQEFYPDGSPVIRKAKSIMPVGSLTKLEELDLRRVELRHTKSMPNIVGLKRLKITPSSLPSADFSHLEQYKHLEYLCLDENADNQVTTGFSTDFRGGTQWINMDATPHFEIDSWQSIGKLKSLKELEIPTEGRLNNSILADDFSFLVGLSNIEKLDIDMEYISADRIYPFLGGLTKLETLDLHYCAHTTEAHLEILKNLPKLKRFVLNGELVNIQT